MALSGNGLYLAVGGSADTLNRGAVWVFQASPYAKVTYSVDVAPGTNETGVQEALERNIDEILLGAITRAPSSSEGVVGRLLEPNCNQSKSLQIVYFAPSQGLTSSQIQSILNSSSKADLFGDYSGDVCRYAIPGVDIISRTSEAPSPVPRKEPKCLNSCLLEYSYDKFACRDKFVIPELACKIMARITKFKCIRQTFLEPLCFLKYTASSQSVKFDA